ncbi:MAG: hypothetical protein ABL908_20990, partial [Hyphomicrobium sp.]
MFVVIAILVILTIAAAYLAFAPRIPEVRLVYDVQADRPVAFGYKMAWLAIRTKETQAVVAALDLVA